MPKKKTGELPYNCETNDLLKIYLDRFFMIKFQEINVKYFF